MKKRNLILFIFLLTYNVIFSQENKTGSMTPYAEAYTSNFEVVVAYNNIQINQESKLIFYISDYKSNTPVENAQLELNINGVEDSKIRTLPPGEPGVYEIMVNFPEIKKYNFMLTITAGSKNDLIPINDVDIGKKEEVKTEKESISIIQRIHQNLFIIIIAILLIAITWYVSYRITLNKHKHAISSYKKENEAKIC